MCAGGMNKMSDLPNKENIRARDRKSFLDDIQTEMDRCSDIKTKWDCIVTPINDRWNIYSFHVYCPDLEYVDRMWEEWMYTIDTYFQTKEEVKIIERWNIFLFFHVNVQNADHNEYYPIFKKIESDMRSCRKILVRGDGNFDPMKVATEYFNGFEDFEKEPTDSTKKVTSLTYDDHEFSIANSNFVVIYGSSAMGKTSIINSLVREYPDELNVFTYPYSDDYGSPYTPFHKKFNRHKKIPFHPLYNSSSENYLYDLCNFFYDSILKIKINRSMRCILVDDIFDKLDSNNILTLKDIFRTLISEEFDYQIIITTRSENYFKLMQRVLDERFGNKSIFINLNELRYGKK